jgi:hypothetical protein
MKSFDYYINNVENDYKKLDDCTKRHFKEMYDKCKQNITDDDVNRIDKYFNVNCFRNHGDCYFNINCNYCTNIYGSENCDHMIDCAICVDCNNCSDCICSENLEFKRMYSMNRDITKKD